jgi:hypothetical protein
MADNVAITAGSGTSIATDDCGAGGHTQLVKLAISTDGDATPITADAKGLEVQQATAADFNCTEASAADIKTALQIIDDWDASDHCNIRHLTTTDDSVNARPAETAATMKHARVALSSSQTGSTVLDPANGTKMVLHKLVVSCATAGVVDFFYDTDSGDDVIGPLLSLAANGGWTETWGLSAPRRAATADDVLKYTTTTFAGSVYIEYWEE